MDRVCNDHEPPDHYPQWTTVRRDAFPRRFQGIGGNSISLTYTCQRQASSCRRCSIERRQRGWAEARQVKLLFADEAWEDYLYWQKQDKRMVERINKLIRETQREPFAGVGKPEPLKHALAGFWSRRITDEHRMVYRGEGKILMIAQLRFHY